MAYPIGDAFDFCIPISSPTLPGRGRGAVGHNIDGCVTNTIPGIQEPKVKPFGC